MPNKKSRSPIVNHSLALSIRIAEIMEPQKPKSQWNTFGGEISPGGWWIFNHTDGEYLGYPDDSRWVPRLSLDGKNPILDAQACYLMKARLSHHYPWVKFSITYDPWFSGEDQPWECQTMVSIWYASSEVLTVAQCLIDVIESDARRKTNA